MGHSPIRMSIIGGFDRRDVIESLKRISDERNTAVRERDALRTELDAALAVSDELREENTVLAGELIAARESVAAAKTAAEAAICAEKARCDAEIAEAKFDAIAAKQVAEAAKTELETFKTAERAQAAVLIEDLEAQLRSLRERLV